MTAPVTPRRPGRPRLEGACEPSEAVYLTLSARQYAELARHARAQRATIQDVIRFGVQRYLRTQKT